MPPRPEDALLAHYDQALETHGDTPEGALWPNARDRGTRFDVMLEVLADAPDAQFSLPTSADVSQSTGKLYEYLAGHGHPIRYGYVPRAWPLALRQAGRELRHEAGPAGTVRKSISGLVMSNFFCNRIVTVNTGSICSDPYCTGHILCNKSNMIHRIFFIY